MSDSRQTDLYRLHSLIIQTVQSHSEYKYCYISVTTNHFSVQWRHWRLP